MSDNEDLLGDDLGDHSLADYNLGNEEEEQLLADDYEGNSQNVPSAVASYREPVNVVPVDYAEQNIEYSQPVSYAAPETECVVPNLIVEVTNTRPEHCTYAPYEPEHAVPPAIPAAPLESPQIVPSEMPPIAIDADGSRERFISERPVGAQRTPQVRNIPDSLDKVFVPRGMGGAGGRGRNSWRAPHFRHAQGHPYRRHAPFRTNFSPRPSFPPPQRPSPPQIRQEFPEIRSEIPQHNPPEQQILPDIREPFQNFQRFPFRPNMDDRPNFIPNQPFERPMFRPFGPIREIIPNNNIPQVTIRQPLPVLPVSKGLEPEVRMLPVLPPNLPGGLTGKKVLINPHFKGNFQPPVEGPIKDIDDAAERFIAEQRSALARAASRNLRRSPQRYIENTTIEIENELARSRRSEDELLRKQEEFIHANRAGLRRRMRTPSPPRRSRSPTPPLRDARDTRDSRDIRDTRDIRDRDRRDDRRPRPAQDDEDSDYRRRVREQESMRERVLRAKEVRRRKNAVALQKQLQEREREKQEKPKLDIKENPSSTREEEIKPDTTKKSPEREDNKTVEIERQEKQKEKSPLRDEVEVNSTCEALTPPRETLPTTLTPERSDTPPLPPRATPPRPDSDDDLDLILGDIDGILSDDEDSGRFKDKDKDKTEQVESSKPQADLRSKLPPKSHDRKPAARQKIIFTAGEDNKRREKSPIRRTIVSSSTKIVETVEKKPVKVKSPADNTTAKSRQRIIFDTKKAEKAEDENSQKFSNRRVILQRKITEKEKSVFSRMEQTDPTKPNPGIFNRAFKTAIEVLDKKKVKDIPRKIVKSDDGSRKVVRSDDGSRKIVRSDDGSRKVVRNDDDDPQIEYESGSDDDILEREVGLIADVSNLPHGMTDTRLKTLAGDFVQSLILDKGARTAKITFKTTTAAESFKRKFNNKMVAASRLAVTLQ